MTSTSDAPHKVYRDRFEVIFTKGGATIGLFVTRGWLQNALDARGLPLAQELSDQDFAHHVFRCCETNDMLAHAIASRNSGGRAFGKSVAGVSKVTRWRRCWTARRSRYRCRSLRASRPSSDGWKTPGPRTNRRPTTCARTRTGTCGF